MNPKIYQFKEKLNHVFDDNLHTKQWHNYVDYAIISLIILSTLEVFASTFPGIEQQFNGLLKFVDIFTTIVFTIEVTLRIWNADMLDPKYKGFWGRIRYCLSFYGLIDILSTYPFYVSLFTPIPYTALKVLRVARLLRVFRYMHSFRLLTSALKSKKSELLVSLQFLTIVTIILSFILYFVEHIAQPEVYTNGWDSVVWAFMQYIGDPGGFADYPPITVAGHVIAVLVGVLGIAIFAVPAGLIGSGFTEVMEAEQADEELKENVAKINELMLLRSIKREGIVFPAQNMSFGDLKLYLGLTEEEILKAVEISGNLRVMNKALAIKGGDKTDMLIVNQFYRNTDYGCHLERGSSVTIVDPIGVGDNGLSFFDWHIAQLGGFNYISNEFFSRTKPDKNYRYNFYTIQEETENNPVFQQFIDDILRDRDENDWIVLIAGEQIVKNITDVHFECGGEKGETTFDFPGCITHDRKKLKTLYDDLSKTLADKAELTVDAHQVQPLLNKSNLARYIQSRTKANVLLLTISYKLMIFDKNVHTAIYQIANVLNRNLECKGEIGLHTEEYLTRSIDNPYWRNLYLPPKYINDNY